MAKCFFCDLEAMEGHLTCGLASCPEADARAQVHSARNPRRGGGAIEQVRRARREREGLVYNSKESINEPIKQGLVPAVCGAENGYMKVRCALPFDHEGDLHATGGLCWRRGERPRYMDDETRRRLEPAMEAESDADRLAQLQQALITAKSQMLGLGTGLEEALSSMPRAVDKNAVRGLIAALAHIVKTLDSHKIAEGETALRQGVRIGTDGITASAFDKSSPMQRAGQMSELAASAPQVLVGEARDRHIASKVFGFDRGYGKSVDRVKTLPEGAREPVVHWRGSVGDLVTDLEPILGVAGMGLLVAEVRERMGIAEDGSVVVSVGTDRTEKLLPMANPLRELVDELQRRLAGAEARMKQLEAERRAPVSETSKILYSKPLAAFVELIERESRDAGPLSDTEREVLEALVGGIVGLPFQPPASSAAMGDWGAACERLERIGFLEGYAHQFRPTVRGMRHGLVLLGARRG